MSDQDTDSQLVDYLYGEMSDEEQGQFERLLESDNDLSSEVSSFDDVLSVFHSVPEDEPPAHLDALILANARQVTESIKEEASEKSVRGWFRKIFASPIYGLAAAGSIAVVAAVVAVPTLMLQRQNAETGPASIPFERPAVAIAPSVAPKRADEPLAKMEMKKLEESAKDKESSPSPRMMRRSRTKPKSQPKGRKADFDLGAVADSTPKPMQPPTLAQAGRGPSRKSGKKKATTTFYANGKAEAESGSAPMDDVAVALDPAPPPPRKPSRKKKAKRASAPERSKARSAGGDSGDSRREKAILARDLIRAAETALRAGNVDEARKILLAARSRTAGTPSCGDVQLRLARLELSQKRPHDALYYARAAARTPGFTRKQEALRLIREIEQNEAKGSDAMESAAPSPTKDR